MADQEDVAGGLAHRPEIGLRHGQLPDELRGERADDRSVRPDDLAHDLRLVQLAAVGERGVCVDQLDRGDDVVALADPGLVRLARVDRLAEEPFLPGIGRHDSSHLSGEIDPGRRAEAVLMGPVGEPLDPEHAGELEEERVA